MKSILQSEKGCWVCRRKNNLASHHVFFGTANRKKSEKYGLKVWLCYNCHTGQNGVHFNPSLDKRLKMMAQEEFEKRYGHEKFMEEFGKNWR